MRLEAVLAAHERHEQFTKPGKRKGLIEWASRCICGEPMPWMSEDREAAHRAHLAAAVLDWLWTELAAEGMREAAPGLPWGDAPYDARTPTEVVHDYVMVRGDLSEQYARDQLALWIDRYAHARATAALEAVAERLAGGER